MPDLVPVEYDPFADNLQGDVGAAAQRLQQAEAQRRNTMGQLLSHFTLPGRVAQGVRPETPGMMSEVDAFRLNQLQNEAQNWAPQQALNMIGGGTPRAEAGAVGSGGGGIKAYHGSPYDFERFDLSKIGTGEGAQAFGHGLYFTERPEVADYYRNYVGHMGTDWNDAASVARYLADKHGGRESAIANTRIYPQTDQATRDAVELLKNPDFEIPERKGRTYEVSINADPGHFLDWDKPLSEQHPKVQEALQNATQTTPLHESAKGSDYYWQINNLLKQNNPAMKSGIATNIGDELRQAGIPGIKYLDQGSRGEGKGTYNYVVFDDKLIDILKKYSMAGLTGTAGLMAAIKTRAAQQRGEQQQ